MSELGALIAPGYLRVKDWVRFQEQWWPRAELRCGLVRKGLVESMGEVP